MPSDETPFEDILAFRSQHTQQLRGLRIWACDIAAGKLTGREVQDKLQYLIAEYEEQLRILRVAKSRRRIEIVVTTVADIAENLAHLKFGAAVKAFFAFRHESANLLLSERKLTGREVSYVVDARQQFSPESPGV